MAISSTDPRILARIVRDATTGERTLDKIATLYPALANRSTRLGTLVAVRRHQTEQLEPDTVIQRLVEAAIAEKKSRK